MAKTDAGNAGDSSAVTNSTVFAEFDGNQPDANIPRNGQYLDVEAREINGVTVIRSRLRWMMLEAQGKADQLFFGDNLKTLLFGQYARKYGEEAARAIWQEETWD